MNAIKFINKFANFIIISGIKSESELDVMKAVGDRCELEGVSK